MSKKLKKLLAKNKIIVLGTSAKSGEPNLVVVASCGIFNNKILIADCQLNKTLNNLRENKRVAVCAFDNKNYFQVKGRAVYITKGNFFDMVKKINEGTPYKPKGAILVSIDKIWNLENCKRLKC